MTLRLYIPLDAAALAVGADEVAAGVKAAAARRNVAIDIIRTGSRGLYWLEPMVETETPAGRVAYGPAAPASRPASSGARWRRRRARRSTSSVMPTRATAAPSPTV